MEEEFEKLVNKEYKTLLMLIGRFVDKERIAQEKGTLEVFGNEMGMVKSQVSQYKNAKGGMTLKSFCKLYLALNKTREDIFKEIITGADKEPSPEEFRLAHDIELQVRHQVEITLGKHISNELSGEDVRRLFLILAYCRSRKLKKNELLEKFTLSYPTRNFNKMLALAVDAGWLAMTFPNSKNHKNQRYYTTEAGSNILKLRAAE